MKHVIALLSLVMLTSVTANAATDAALLGTWRSTVAVFSNQQMGIFIALGFKADSTADMSAICHYADGKEITATVNIKVDVANGHISTLESKHAEVSDGSYNCNVSIDAAVTAYSVAGNALTLTPMNAAPLTLTKQ